MKTPRTASHVRATCARAVRPGVAASALIAAAGAAEAIDSVDLQILPRDRVHGTLRPADERESFFVAGLRGSTVRATVRKTGQAGPVPGVEMLDPDLAVAATGKATKSGATLPKSALAATAGYRFRVSGDGTDGDYRLDVTVTPRKAWTAESSTDLDPGAETTFAVAAPEDAVATIDLTAPRGSALGPLLVDVTAPSGAVLAIDPAGAAAARHRTKVTLAEAGEHVVRFRNSGAEAGAWRISVRLSFPKQKRNTVDLRDEALGGDFAGAQAVFGRIVDDDTETTISLPDGLGLDGASITIPAGALALPTLVSVTASEPFLVEGDAQYSAGAAVDFSPAGTTFAQEATLTLPYDPDAFDDAATELTLVLESEDGTQETVAPSSIDGATSTATFPVSHFTRFQPASPRPRPLRGLFAEIELVGRTVPGFGSEIVYGRNSVFVPRGGRRDLQSGTRVLRRGTVGWAVDMAGTPRLRASADEPVAQAIAAAIGADAEVTIQTPADSLAFDRGRGGDALIAATSRTGPSFAEVRFHALLRRADGPSTRTNLAGRWHAAVLEFSAAETQGAPIAVAVTRRTFELTVDAFGRAVASSSSRGFAVGTSRQLFPTGRWTHDAGQALPKSGRMDPVSPDGPYDVVLNMPLGSTSLADEVRLAPVLRGDMLVGGGAAIAGVAADPSAGAVRVVVLVRHASGLTRDDLAARFLEAAFLARPVNAAAPPNTLDVLASRGDLTFSESALAGPQEWQAHLDLVEDRTSHDESGDPVLSRSAFTSEGIVRVLPDGSVTRLPGFLAPRRLALLVPPSIGQSHLGLAVPVPAPLVK